MLKQIHKEKDEEMVKVDMWCHFGHAYVTKVDEGEMLPHLFAFEKRRSSLKVPFRRSLDKISSYQLTYNDANYLHFISVLRAGNVFNAVY